MTLYALDGVLEISRVLDLEIAKQTNFHSGLQDLGIRKIPGLETLFRTQSWPWCWKSAIYTHADYGGDKANILSTPLFRKSPNPSGLKRYPMTLNACERHGEHAE